MLTNILVTAICFAPLFPMIYYEVMENEWDELEAGLIQRVTTLKKNMVKDGE